MKYVTFEYAVNVPTLNTGSFVSHLVALEYQKDGEFAGSWKYINKSCGGDEGTTKNWGESGVSFSRVCDATSNKPGAYFKEGYQWVKVDFYMTDSVSSFSIRFSAGRNNAYWLHHIPFNELVAENVTETAYAYEPTGLQKGDQVILRVTAVNADGVESNGIRVITWLESE